MQRWRGILQQASQSLRMVCVDASPPSVVGTRVRRRCRRRRRRGWVILVCFGATHLHHRFRAVGGRQPRARRVVLEVTPGPVRTLSTMMECVCVCVCGGDEGREGEG